jgi:DNA-binding CsgD family transcriptional regulator
LHPAAAIQERIHALWDTLADFEASQADEALRHLMAELCGLVEAQNAVWVGAVRLDGSLPGDPVKGWRPRTVRYLHPASPLHDAVREQTEKLESGNVDETTLRNVAGAGTFRVNRLVDLVSPEWFDSGYCRDYYHGAGIADAIWAGVPINEDTESYFGIKRHAGHPPFTVEEREAVAHVLRGLKWFLRRQMLSHGLLVANIPLTPVERQVLHGLLGGQSEKEIAAAQGRSPHTTHGYVTSIYRKYGVNNRAALMALWLGRS